MISDSQTQNTTRCSMKILIHLAENGKADQRQLTTKMEKMRRSCTKTTVAKAVCVLYSKGFITLVDSENAEGEADHTYDITREGIVKVLLQNNYNLDKAIDRAIPRLNQHFADWMKARRRFLGETRTKRIIRDIAPLLTAPPRHEKEDEKQFVQSLAFITAMPQLGVTTPISTKVASSQKTLKHHQQHLGKHKNDQIQTVVP
ncbi:MAG: hypothetical protein M1503_04520 [Thaumarchaeota archaeon]|nr:hypothetical protein [Nitrososphaerota archaeon]MCL5317514.1 hypothetical protein [Nitrososphaerota archaeon]